MGKTSNESKQRWNAANYTQIKVSVTPELASAFKVMCAEKGVSLAAELSRFMREQTAVCLSRNNKPDLDTRQKRRKTLARISKQIEDVLGAEQRYMDNILENLRNSCRYEAAEQTISHLEEALAFLNEAY